MTTRYKTHVQQYECCAACSLWRTRNRVVLGRGKLPCDVLFVGEAPGASENVLGYPFMGPAGKLLNRQITDAEALAGCSVRLAFTNLTGCMPLNKDPKKAGEPSVQSIKACKPRLADFIDRVARPAAIVAVGALAAKWIPKHGYEVDVEITHPSYILKTKVEQRSLLIQRVIVQLADIFAEVDDLDTVKKA